MTLSNSSAPRPLPLTMIMVMCLIIGAFALLAIALAPLDVFTYTLNGRSVDGETFLRGGGLRFLVDGVLLLAAGIGVYRRDRWARPVLAAALLYRATQAVITFNALTIFITYVFGVVPLLLPIWYVYRAESVRRYFGAM